MARYFGLSTQVFGRYEKAISKLHVTRLVHLSEVLGFHPMELVYAAAPHLFGKTGSRRLTGSSVSSALGLAAQHRRHVGQVGRRNARHIQCRRTADGETIVGPSTRKRLTSVLRALRLATNAFRSAPPGDGGKGQDHASGVREGLPLGHRGPVDPVPDARKDGIVTRMGGDRVAGS